MKIGIVEKKDFSEPAFKRLSSIGVVEFFGDGSDLTTFLMDKDAIFVRLKHFWDKKLLAGAKSIKYICSPTTGLNHIDLDYCARRGIEVVSLKGEVDFLTENIAATPEHTLGLTIALLRNYSRSFLSSDNPVWDRDRYKGEEIFEKKIGIIGYGRVGRKYAKYLNSFGAKVFFYDIDKLKITNGFAKRLSNWSELCEQCDIVAMCASYSKEYDSFFDKRYLKLLKNKYFINTARGELVDERELIKLISKGYFAGVGLDVIRNENGKNNLNKFIRLTKKSRNLIITPHIAGATHESMSKTEMFVAEKLIRITKS
ncbi:MAG: D-3-phosphoglycerate dehydrogenase [candidate division WS2 bacterium ADurb.Bin280]|uniref:D-3-phosphoglycerate dehydrogenase n=1 Tax=candidate division WS2 bacterium ADurb.Bin280 TaxID=1852829 RepID=A0A1V5SBY8_9BACT|nr:MAG: D-3-phosphoglycerate dehydrogenase [candidate division WS2 bacterium ADurb.Bin280]